MAERTGGMAAMLDDVRAVAAEAAALALASWRGTFDHWEKSPGNPVSAVDMAVDALLRERLAAIDPAAGWLSEETADNADRLSCRRVWVVDPIDGTRDFVRGRRGWAVSVALVEDGEVVLGVLEAPARGERWYGLRGGGAFCGADSLAVKPRAQLAGARVPADWLPTNDEDLVCVAKPNSIALRIAMVASGEADLLATLRWGYEWDIAAAALIASEAGAVVTDACGQPIGYNSPRGEAFGVLVTAPGIHAQAVARLAGRAANAIVR